MRLLALAFCCWSTWCLANTRRSTGRSWGHQQGRGRGYGIGHQQGRGHERRGRQGRAWEPGGLKQLRHLQDHGVNLRHLQEQGVNLGHLHEIAPRHVRGRAKTSPWQDSEVSSLNVFLFLCVI